MYEKEIFKTRKNRIAELLGLETDPQWEEYMLLTRDEDWAIIEWVSFSNELDEIVSYIEYECKIEQEMCENWWV